MTDIFEEAEAMARAEADRYDAWANSPTGKAAIAERRAAEFAKGVRLGWWDAEGNALPQPNDDDDDDDDDEIEENEG